ncbi:MAG: FAD-dependent thymidylate synthase [Gemmatimonadales bacterium]|nr:FAD-dependent thymidylate synthase [Gemmatimonadales bacterium]MYG18716.1 FAD-dependent thymidylate synthase [Gemmatimonadales bacterium]MYH10623.1 FAD-dependent thymidylate synthase [Gemmatimonadales bacterium]MYL07442.1 FAD-dependent thymidylate synthase [Gemmatimonadales bacterium]
METTGRPTVAAAEEILGGYFPVLDHGFVALVDYMGSDADVEAAARVSYGAGTRRVSQTRGLVRYLRRHAHTTPSEMVEFKFHCSMPMFVARQWIRHRTASVNELSARYSLLPLLFYEPDHEQFAYQSRLNNQGREMDPAPGDLYRSAVDRWEQLRTEAADAYGWLLSEDVARELARIDLPLSTYTQWYWKIDLHNLLHFLRLRVDAHAQWEIQEYGRVMAGMLQRVAPLSYEAWVDYEVLGARLSAGELEVLRSLLRADAESESIRAEGVATKEDLKAAGLAPREIRELLDKLSAVERPDFTLDLSQMKSAEEMSGKMAKAVPEPTA